MVLSYEVNTKTSLACNKLFLQQRKSELDISRNLLGIYSQNYTIQYLKQRNIISFKNLHLKLSNINFLAFQLQHTCNQRDLPMFLFL